VDLCDRFQGMQNQGERVVSLKRGRKS
jgi:hypothetical protein